MSRLYRIRIAESTQRHLRVEDGFQIRLEVLNVLAPEQMKELLAKELAGLGFEREGDLMTRSEEDGVLLQVDLQESTLTARVCSEDKVELAVEKTRGIEEEVLEEGKKRLQADVMRELEAKVAEKQAELERETTRGLNQTLLDLREELNPASNRAIAAALKIRARQLGTIEEISENLETGEITIRVEV